MATCTALFQSTRLRFRVFWFDALNENCIRPVRLLLVRNMKILLRRQLFRNPLVMIISSCTLYTRLFSFFDSYFFRGRRSRLPSFPYRIIRYLRHGCKKQPPPVKQWLVVVLALKYSAPSSVENLQTCIRKGSCTSDQRRLSLRVQRRFCTFYRRKRFRRPRFSQPHTDAILQYNPSPQSASSPLCRQRPSSACP